MSTILKALRRLEEDRNAQSRRPLREEVASGGVSTNPPRRRWTLVGAALALGIAAGAGLLAFWSASREVEPTELAAAAATESPAPAAAATQSPASAAGSAPLREPRVGGVEPRPSLSAQAASDAGASTRELSAAALASQVEVVRRPPAEPRIADPDATREVVRGRGRRTSLPRKVAPGLMPGRHKRAAAPAPTPTAPPGPGTWVAAVPREPAPEVPEPPPETALIQQTSPEPSTRRTEAKDESAPEPEAPPPARSSVTRAEPPGLRVERTLWHPVAERRLAVIRLDGDDGPRQIREGDAVGPLVVSEIEPSGVVFVHEGVELRRRVGD